MKITVTFLVVMLFAVPAYADLKLDIAKCAAGKTDAIRLICYDKIAGELKVDFPRTEQIAGSGKWKGNVETSPIDDSKNVYLSLKAETPVRTRSGRNR